MNQDPLEELELERGEPRFVERARNALLVVFMASSAGAFFVILGILAG